MVLGLDFTLGMLSILIITSVIFLIGLMQRHWLGMISLTQKISFKHNSQDFANYLPSLIVVVQSNGKVIQVNSSLKSILGYKLSDWLQKNITNLVVPRDFDIATYLLAQATSLPGQPITVEMRVSGVQGEVHCFEVTATNLLQIENVAGILLNFQDITKYKLKERELQENTISLEEQVQEKQLEFHLSIVELQHEINERKRTEANLEQSLSLLKATLESTTDGILVVNRQRQISTFNQNFVQMWRVPPEIMQLRSSNSLLDFNAPQLKNPQAFLAKVQNLYDKPEAESFDILKFKDGRVLERYSRPQRIGSEVVGRVWIFRDITERRRIESRNYALTFQQAKLLRKTRQQTKELIEAKELADAASNAKSLFLANMSHELRTPLNAILGFSHILLNSSEMPSNCREEAQLINHSGKYLLGLINEILDLSKIESGHVEVNESEFDLYQLLTYVRNIFSLKAQEKSLDLIFKISPNLPQYIQTDEAKLQQILINLINNAIKFTTQGQVVVRTKLKESNLNKLDKFNIIFEVEDTGDGIADEELGKLFQPFEQTSSGKKSQEGTGLGLAISQRFVQLLGGEISVKSKVHKGSRFCFYIPVTKVRKDLERKNKKDLSTSHLLHKVIHLAPNQPKYKILVVDDTRVNRLLLIKLLRDVGFDVQEASNGKEAVALSVTWQPHLIFMDIRMPMMDGYEAIKEIRAHESTHNRFPKSIIIALTASVLKESKANILALGCEDFVSKPFEPQLLFSKIAEYLGVQYTYDSTSVS